jgi:hypothetical protein
MMLVYRDSMILMYLRNRTPDAVHGVNQSSSRRPGIFW